ncbi:MAG: hypothetical protein GX022_09875 [Clostridiaceae bacterium]|nr:hypothetical protein [Clostridiaceae bacterium]
MKKEELKSSFDKVEPDQAAQMRMLNNILSHSGKEKKAMFNMFNYRKALPALGLAIVIAGSILFHNMMSGKNNLSSPGYEKPGVADAREDMAAPLINQFQLDDRHYILLSDDLRAEYGFPQQIDKNDIGIKLTTIAKSVDPSLIGCEVYYYKPAGSEAVVAVKKNDSYMLFKFFTFESYINNKDEDAVEYLKLFGINSAEDIAKIQFIEYSMESRIKGGFDIISELTGPDEIAQFYGYFSVLKDSSDKYFDKLFNYNTDGNRGTGLEVDVVPHQVAPVPPDAGQNIAYPEKVTPPNPERGRKEYAEDMPMVKSYDSKNGTTEGRSALTDEPGAIMDMGSTEPVTGGTTPAQVGVAGNALANSVYIRIYNKSGIYFETIYYRNIGFMSRYEVNKEFADFLEGYIK